MPLAGITVVGVAPFVLIGVFSSTMQLRGRPGLEYSDAGLRGARTTVKVMVNQCEKEDETTRKQKEDKIGGLFKDTTSNQ